MKKTFGVIGLDSFGVEICHELKELGVSVIAVDNDMDNVNLVANFVDLSGTGEISNESVLKNLGFSQADHVIVSMNKTNVEEAILAILILNEMKIKDITVKVENEQLAKVAMKIGATFTIFPDKSTARRIARKVMNDSILDYYNVDNEYGVYELRVGKQFQDMSLKDLDLRNKYDVNIILIRKDDGTIIIPGGVDVLSHNDIIMVVGKHKKISKLQNIIND